MKQRNALHCDANMWPIFVRQTHIYVIIYTCMMGDHTQIYIYVYIYTVYDGRYLHNAPRVQSGQFDRTTNVSLTITPPTALRRWSTKRGPNHPDR